MGSRRFVVGTWLELAGIASVVVVTCALAVGAVYRAVWLWTERRPAAAHRYSSRHRRGGAV
jgi:hypothetical protein